MAKVIYIIDGQQLIGDVQTGDIEDAAVTDAKIGGVSGTKITTGTIPVGAIDPTLLSYFLPFCKIDVGEIDYSIIE